MCVHRQDTRANRTRHRGKRKSVPARMLTKSGAPDRRFKYNNGSAIEDNDAKGAAARASSNSFKRRCESMLRKVPRVKQGACGPGVRTSSSRSGTFEPVAGGIGSVSPNVMRGLNGQRTHVSLDGCRRVVPEESVDGSNLAGSPEIRWHAAHT